MSLALHKSVNSEDDDEEDLCAMVPTPHDAWSDPASVVKVLQKKVIEDYNLFLTIRLNRVVQLRQRGRKKKPVEYKLSIKYLGEEGTDTGALSRAFLANVISDIAKTMFPNGRRVHCSFRMRIFRSSRRDCCSQSRTEWTSTMLLGRVNYQ